MIRRREAPGRPIRRGRLATVTFALVLALVAPSGALAVPASAAPSPLTPHSVAVSIVSVTPTTLTPSTSPTPSTLTVVLSLTNNSTQNLTNLTVKGARSNPISTRSALDGAIAKVQPPDPGLLANFNARSPVTVSLTPGQSAQVEFVAQTSTDVSTEPGLCICNDLIYPLYLTVTAFDNSSAATVVGSAQTYEPAFSTAKPAPVQVAWVWPLIDRPHRLGSSKVFFDDELAASVSAAGRLDRLLQVVETVAAQSIAMTLVIDPDLIDELTTMTTGYGVTARGVSVTGAGGPVARAWLDRLSNALRTDPKLEVDLTPLADPDVESLTRAGLGWTALNRQAATDVSTALGGYPVGTNVAWPLNEQLSSDTLNTLASQGITSVILDDHVLPTSGSPDKPANQLGVLQTPAGQLRADVTNSSIQRWVAPVLTNGGPGLSELPQLVSEVAVDAVTDSQVAPAAVSHYVCLVAPRMLNPAPDASAAAIIDTSSTYWSVPITLGEAAVSVTPADHDQLAPPAPGRPALPAATIGAVQSASVATQALTSMFTSVDASSILGPFPVAVQRAESSAWTFDPAAGSSFARLLASQVASIESGVELVKPTTGTYTLASSNSPLPVTIINHLPVQVTVRVSVTTKNDLPGFAASDTAPRVIAAGNRAIVQLPTHVDRAGRFKVEVWLLTPNGVRIDQPVELSVRSTALGAIGVIITVVAAVVLALALLIRLVRRLRAGPTPRDPDLAGIQ